MWLRDLLLPGGALVCACTHAKYHKAQGLLVRITCEHLGAEWCTARGYDICKKIALGHHRVCARGVIALGQVPSRRDGACLHCDCPGAVPDKECMHGDCPGAEYLTGSVRMVIALGQST